MDNKRRSVALLNPFPSPYRLPMLNPLAKITDMELTANFRINFTFPFDLLRGKHDVIVTFRWTTLFSNHAHRLGRLLGATVI